jgi:hypothetical protein
MISNQFAAFILYAIIFVHVCHQSSSGQIEVFLSIMRKLSFIGILLLLNLPSTYEYNNLWKILPVIGYGMFCIQVRLNMALIAFI